MRIPEHFGKLYGLTEIRALDHPFLDIPKMTNIHSETNFHVRRSDIDKNGHVNNARYVDWMLEGIQDDLAHNYQLTELEVVYKKETRYGTNVLSECQKINSTSPEYLHRILDETR